jgi:hypothetical protein
MSDVEYKDLYTILAKGINSLTAMDGRDCPLNNKLCARVVSP